MGTYEDHEDHEDRRGEPEEGPTTSTIYDREHGANKRICYFYDNDYAGMYYGADHPMKPPRIAMTHSLVVGYGLHEKMDVYRPRRAQREELVRWHSEDYVNTLRSTTPEAFKHSLPHGTYAKYGLDEDCPIFPGMFDFCRLYSGASIEGAAKLNSGQYDVAINWAGGLHHAKKASSSGFCYINDCVLVRYSIPFFLLSSPLSFAVGLVLVLVLSPTTTNTVPSGHPGDAQIPRAGVVHRYRYPSR
jgi:hypothetical protein